MSARILGIAPGCVKDATLGTVFGERVALPHTLRYSDKGVEGALLTPRVFIKIISLGVSFVCGAVSSVRADALGYSAIVDLSARSDQLLASFLPSIVKAGANPLATHVGR
jgi:hypothetical protein